MALSLPAFLPPSSLFALSPFPGSGLEATDATAAPWDRNRDTQIEQFIGVRPLDARSFRHLLRTHIVPPRSRPLPLAPSPCLLPPPSGIGAFPRTVTCPHSGVVAGSPAQKLARSPFRTNRASDRLSQDREGGREGIRGRRSRARRRRDTQHISAPS